MEECGTEKSETSAALFDLAMYLVASARDCMEEPLVYGPLRMLVGVDMIINATKQEASLRDEFLIGKQEGIWNEVLAVMNDRAAFAKALDQMLADFAEELKSRTLTKKELTARPQPFPPSAEAPTRSSSRTRAGGWSGNRRK